MKFQLCSIIHLNFSGRISELRHVFWVILVCSFIFKSVQITKFYNIKIKISKYFYYYSVKLEGSVKFNTISVSSAYQLIFAHILVLYYMKLFTESILNILIVIFICWKIIQSINLCFSTEKIPNNRLNRCFCIITLGTFFFFFIMITLHKYRH